MAKKSIYYNLGVYIANHLIDKHIPSISCNKCTNNIVKVTYGEAKKLKRLNDAWYSKSILEASKITKGLKGVQRYKKEIEADMASEKEWNELMKYRYILKEKYLPHVIKFNIPNVDFSNEKNNKK